MHYLGVWCYFPLLINLILIEAFLLLRHSSHLNLVVIRAFLGHPMHFYLLI